MLLFLTLILAIALGVALLKLRQHRQGLQALEQAINQRQKFLSEDGPARYGPAWDRICSAINNSTEELNRLQLYRANQLAQLEATLGSLQEAVLIVDDRNQILLANQALQSIFPGAKNILGSRLELVLQSRAFLDYVTAVRKGSAKAQQPIEFARNTDSVWAEVTGTSVPPLDGQKDQWALFVIHDITRQRQLEAVRKDFVANVSHELRTPLSVIKGYIETLVDEHRAMPVENRDRFLHTVQRHTERLNSLLDDLLTLSRLESLNPGLTRESVSIAQLIAGVLEDYRGRPAGAGHQLNLSIDPSIGPVLLDQLKITQIFENLLDNALKYTPAGSHIDISAKLKEREIELCVKDNGQGIPAEDLPHIFERFYRVDKGRSREKGGTGLGLSIVKHIVQLHGGRVWVESQLGQGSAFFFTLPLRQ
ncbi:MAG: PAS domain-containing protein [Cephaloticoccus sp.]|nr:PAS domain-containing protein [Cephaloticoccus sp.]MCF7761372.1 PAS domain-containing protein [Cephaloticoccus sp.]